jgi:glyoxylase-like metal-dependent hydrolase (beta-lactamase superfamily II)
VLAHENSLKNQKTVAIDQKIEDVQLYPDQTFGTVWCDEGSDQDICLYYFGAGHTNGDAVIHFKHANIAHMGDLLFNRMHPYVDRSAGANIKNWIDVLDKTANKFDRKTKYVFGHAAEGYQVTGSSDDLKVFGDYLGKILKFTEGEIKAGKTKEEFLKTTSLPFETQWKGVELIRPLLAAYEELTGKN